MAGGKPLKCAQRFVQPRSNHHDLGRCNVHRSSSCSCVTTAQPRLPDRRASELPFPSLDERHGILMHASRAECLHAVASDTTPLVEDNQDLSACGHAPSDKKQNRPAQVASPINSQ